MTIAWTAVEDAISAWASSATGLEVVWSKQDMPRRPTAYVELAATVSRVGQDWLDIEDAAVPSPGAEIDSIVRGVRELELTVQCFGGGYRGATSGMGHLESMITKARLQSQQDLFEVAGWAPASFDPVLDISGVIGSATFEPRARFVCRGFAASELSETGTFIEIVEITNQIDGSTFTVDSTP